MNNEIGRKITSLTLMTIMIAGGMTFAVPGVMPAAHAANANLFVSAENSQFDNYMSGPQVIEVVVIDSDINDTDEAKGEPDVTVNGKKLRMVQGVDGNWYGYFADRKMASIADSTTTSKGNGLDFGTLCATGSTTNTFMGVTVGETVGVAVPLGGLTGSIGQNGTSTGGPLTTQCAAGSNSTGHMNVVREQKDVNTNSGAGGIGQIGISDADLWPFVQLYTLNPTGNVVVQYNKGGGAQTTTLTFDTVDQFAGLELDRTTYPQGSQVHATITDLWLNIDPTDEDSWTFGANSADSSKGAYYQVFDENGDAAGAGSTTGVIQLTASKLGSLMCEDNCQLLLDPDAQGTDTVITIQDNDDSDIAGESEDPSTASVASNPGSLTAGSFPITIVEQGPTSGIFGTYDESDTSALKITENAKRGTSATLDYNETPITVLAGFSFATIDIQPIDNEWTSGEEIPVVIVDGDANKNSRADEDLDLNNPAVDLIPSLRTGDPFTLGEAGLTAPKALWSNVANVSGTTTGTVTATTPVLGNLTGAASSFGVLGATGVTNSGPTNVTGNLGSFPTGSITGFPPGVVNGTIESATTDAANAQIDARAAWNFLGNQTCTNNAPWPADSASSVQLDGLTLGPGVYCAGSTMDLGDGTTLTLDGAGLYIFKVGSSLTTVANSEVVLINGATAENVFWKIDASATLAKPNVAGTKLFPGTVIALTSISQSGSTAGTFLNVTGRLLALEGAVSFASGTTVKVPGLTPTTGGFTGTPSTTSSASTVFVTTDMNVQRFSQRAIITSNGAHTDNLIIDLGTTMGELKKTIRDPTAGTFNGFNFLNLDVRSISSTGTFDVYLLNNTGDIITSGVFDNDGSVGSLLIADDVSPQSFTILNSTTTATNAQIFGIPNDKTIGLLIVSSDVPAVGTTDAIVVDFFSYGFLNDGLQADERIANQIIRIEAEETGDNTSTFEGSLEFIMLNQLNILDRSTYTGLSTIADDPSFIVHDDLDDEDSPRVNYLDLGADGVSTQVSDQEEAPAHSGVVSFDSSSYKIADTVTITLEDQDLNTDSDLIDIFTIVTDNTDDAFGAVGAAGLPDVGFGPLGRLLDVTFDDQIWRTSQTGCTTVSGDTGLDATGFTLVETAKGSGVFTGDFQIPSDWCRSGATSPETATGLDLEVNYVDFRDAAGETIEVGDSAGVRANTGSVSLDRTVYPVPFGVPSDFGPNTVNSPSGRSVFPIHQSGLNDPTGLGSGEFLKQGNLIVHVRVNDPDFDISASGEDEIAQNTAANPVGPVKVSVIRGANSVVLGYAGGDAVTSGVIDVGNTATNVTGVFTGANSLPIRQFGPMEEIAPDAGIFEADITLRYTDGPASSTCPATSSFTNILDTSGTTEQDRFDTASPSGQNYCILQGDILQVEYTDPEDASGDVNTVTDSATFDLRNGVLQSDKSVYIIGSDMIMTLIEPDLDLDSDQAETWDLDLIEWDSDAATTSMGGSGTDVAAFDPEPTDFRETGDSTGIFQIVIEIPEELSGDRLERGEEIVLEYTDWGPSGSDFVGDEDEDVNLTIFTSNFGATVELDQKVYSWTDKVFITIVAPDHNFDSDLVDEVGNTDLDPIKISTRGNSLSNYKLVETGTDTGIFTGEVILTGFFHDADGNQNTGRASDGADTNPRTTPKNNGGPTDGFLETSDDDGITISFEFSEDETVVGSALVRWNIGEVQWLEASYPASGTGVVRIIDPDMNIDPEAVDNFSADVWSDSDAGGIDLTVTETNEATGIFEGTVFFTVNDESSGHRLRVAEGDTVTAEYEDNTLPDPYTTADELDITATTLIGTVVPPLERAPAANLRTVDAFGNSLNTVNVDQQVQITADLANGQDREQAFAYLVQIQDADGVTVSLAWITGSLSPGQSFSPALSWIPIASGTYTATAFVWESVDNPTALSPPVKTTITVS